MKLAKLTAVAALSLTASLSLAAPATATHQQVSGLAELDPGNLFDLPNDTNATNKTQTVTKFFNADKTSVKTAAAAFMAQSQHGKRTKRFGKHVFLADTKSGEILADPNDRYTERFFKRLPHDAWVERTITFVKADKDDFKAADFSKHPGSSAKMPNMTGTMRMDKRHLVEAFVKTAGPDMVKQSSGEELLAFDQTGRVDFDSARKHEGLYMKRLPHDYKAAAMVVLHTAPGGVKNGEFGVTEATKDL